MIGLKVLDTSINSGMIMGMPFWRSGD